MKSFNYQQIDEAYKKIHDKVIKTPLITNDFINNLLNAKVYFKCENQGSPIDHFSIDLPF